MFYVFQENITRERRQVVCIAFFLTEREARDATRDNEGAYFAGKWSCGYAEQQAAKVRGWW